MQGNDISNCSNSAVYFSSQNYIALTGQIYSNNIQNCQYGIKCYKSSPLIMTNDIINCYYGLYLNNNSSPRTCYPGMYFLTNNNSITGSDIAVYAVSSLNPNLGQNNYQSGQNSFVNSGMHILAIAYCNVKAEINYWSPLNSNMFSAQVGSSIDYTPYLSSNPNGAQQSPPGLLLNANANTDMPVTDQTINLSLKDQIQQARIMADNGEIEESQKICKSIIDEYPDSPEAIYALESIWMSSRMEKAAEGNDLESFMTYVKSLSNSKSTNDLTGYARLIDGAEEKASLSAKMDATDYQESDIGAMALYSKFHHQLFVENDVKAAEAILEELQIEYPESHITKNAENEIYPSVEIGKKLLENPQSELDGFPTQFSLSQNYPNPFNPTTYIQLDLPEGADVKLEVYNIQGQKVATLIDGYREAGRYQVLFDGSNLATGIYFYKVNSTKYTDIKRMLLVK